MKLLVILFEELSASALGCYGGRRQTPRIDSLAAAGDVFTMCFAEESSPDPATLVQSSSSVSVNHIDDLDHPDFSSNFLNDNAETFFIRVGAQLSGEHVDQVVGKLLDLITNDRSILPTILFTARRGLIQDSEKVASRSPVGESAAHIPLIVASPEQTQSRRRNELITTTNLRELVPALYSSFEEYSAWRDSLHRQQIEYRSDNAVATRTRDWLLIQTDAEGDDAENCIQLYRKPEDIWEVLEVADQYPQVVEHFQETGILSFPSEI